MFRFPVLRIRACALSGRAASSNASSIMGSWARCSAQVARWLVSARAIFVAFLLLAGMASSSLAQTATPAAKFLSFSAAQIGVSNGSAQTLTASFAVSGYAGTFTPTATLHYGHDYTLGAVNCSGGASETCTVPVTFQPTLPGTRPDAIFLMNGNTRLATVLLDGVGQGPMSLVQPGAFSTSVPWQPQNQYLYQSAVDDNGTVYILASGAYHLIISVDKNGVVQQIPTSASYYVWSIAIDGAGVLYLFNESNVVETYDTVQGTFGTYIIPNPGSDTQWYPGIIGPAGSIDIVDQIHDNGAIDMIDATGVPTLYAVLSPGVLQPDTIATDSQGNVFVGGYQINKITPAGVQTQVNTVGASDGLAVDAADTLYATRYSPTDGVAELPASNYSTPIASFGKSSPLGLSLGSNGTLYVSNYVNLDIFDRSKTETIDFGEVDATQSKLGPEASIYNGGNAPLTVSQFSLSGEAFTVESSQPNDCASGTVLAPGALCNVSVTFAPAHPGTFTGTIAIQSNSLNGANVAQTIHLAGISYGSYDVATPSPLVFSTQAPGASQTLPVTLTNQGNFYSSTVYSVRTDNAAFTIAEGTCTSVAVAVGASCQLQVTFTPAAVQAYTGHAIIDTFVNGTAQPHQTITLPLSGSGNNPAAATPTIAPGTGTYSSSQQVTLTDATASATIYFTTDGSAPTTASTKYTGAITVIGNETLQAIAIAPSYSQSAVATATYTFAYPAVTFTPPSVTFPNQTVNTTSGTQTITVSNTGGAALAISSIALTGANTADFAQTNNCPASLAAGSTCNILVTFTPASASFTAAVTVTDNAAGSPQSVALAGTGTVALAPVATLTPASLAFGNVQQATTSASQTVTLKNTGNAALTISGIAIAGSNPTDFAQTNNCGVSLAAGVSCSISVTFTPASIAGFSATLTVTDNAAGSPHQVSLTGAGIAPLPQTTTPPAALDFGNVIVGETFKQFEVITSLNATDHMLVPSATSSDPAFVLNAFLSDCNIPPGGACQFFVTFAPTAAKAYSATITYTVADGQHPEISYPSQTFTVTGTGIAPPPLTTSSPATLDFGSVIIGETLRKPESITSINTNIIKADSATSSDPAFVPDVANSGCSIPTGITCGLLVKFAPTDAKFHSATITYTFHDVEHPTIVFPSQTFNVTGTGIVPPPLTTPTPATLDFGNVAVHSKLRLSETITSLFTGLIRSDNATSSDPAFVPDMTNSGCTVPTGFNCGLLVTFVPAAAKSYSATITYSFHDTDHPEIVFPAQTFQVTGTGVAPAASITPASLNFSTTVGTTSATQTATLGNTGAAPLNIFNISLSGDPADYQQTNNCPLQLEVGATCTISVVFAPGFVGNYTAEVLVADDDPTTPQVLSLAGNSTITPNFVVASSTPPQSISPGSSAQFSIAVTAENGASIPAVTLSASGLPPGATASFAQASVTPGSASATTTLTIQLQKTAAGNGTPGLPLAGPAAALPALALLGWLFMPRRQQRRWITLGLFLLTLLSGAAAMTGCAGGGFNSVSPAKTYAVTVTATIGAAQQSTTVQLTVE